LNFLGAVENIDHAEANAGLHRVSATGQNVTERPVQLSDPLQTKVGICAERHQFRRAFVAILPAPKLAACGGDEQEQAAAVRQLVGLVLLL
jgi:hypothetical protein